MKQHRHGAKLGEKRIADTWNIGNSARAVVYVQQGLTIRKLRHHEVVKPGETLPPKGTRNNELKN